MEQEAENKVAVVGDFSEIAVRQIRTFRRISARRVGGVGEPGIPEYLP